MSDELAVTDEMLPSPPSNGAGGEDNPLLHAAIEDTFDPSLLDGVPKLGDAIPVGTYHFRLESFKENWTTNRYEKGKAIPLTEDQYQPYFALTWKCQQEPHTGRVVFENVPWVRPEDSKAANDPQNPRRGEAKTVINNRLPRAKEIMEAAGFVPSPGSSFKQFLSTNPEMKLQLKLKEKQQKNQAGEWKGTGEFNNEVQKHISLHRPA